MLKVQRIACTNDAAFVMKFWVGYQDNNNQVHGTSDTGDYPVGQTRVIDLASQGFSEDTLIWPSVAAVFGSQVDGKTKLLYRRTARPRRLP